MTNSSTFAGEEIAVVQSVSLVVRNKDINGLSRKISKHVFGYTALKLTVLKQAKHPICNDNMAANATAILACKRGSRDVAAFKPMLALPSLQANATNLSQFNNFLQMDCQLLRSTYQIIK